MLLPKPIWGKPWLAHKEDGLSIPRDVEYDHDSGQYRYILNVEEYRPAMDAVMARYDQLAVTNNQNKQTENIRRGL